MRTLGSETFEFEPELPLDIVLALDTLDVGSDAETRAWLVAHLVTDAACDTSCADDGQPLGKRKCPAEDAMRKRLRKVRVGGRRLSSVAFHDFYDAVLAEYAVDEGESDSSADSSPTAGETSSGTAPGPVLTVQGSGIAAAAEPEPSPS